MIYNNILKGIRIEGASDRHDCHEGPRKNMTELSEGVMLMLWTSEIRERDPGKQVVL